jgi:hypothetical protein
MTSYRQQLNPWVIHKLLPNLSQSAISRFRRRTEAESYLKLLQRTQPHTHFAITFDNGQTDLPQQAEA